MRKNDDMAQSHGRGFSELTRWSSIIRLANSRKDPSKELTESIATIQGLLDRVSANSRQSVSILLDTENQLRVLSQLVSGWDSVD